ncbi:sulfatase [Candidatus Omnitrophota bacterium]
MREVNGLRLKGVPKEDGPILHTMITWQSKSNRILFKTAALMATKAFLITNIGFAAPLSDYSQRTEKVSKSRIKEQGDKSNENYNIIIVLIDALRFDHLGCYGYKKDVSSNIDKISEKSLIFENAISQATWTKPAVVSLFISDYIKDHGVTIYTNNYTDPIMNNVLPSSSVTLAEVLSMHGYKTKAIINNPFIKKGFGLDQGFGEYDFIGSDHNQTSHALDWIKKNINIKFFLYIHYMAPHADYCPPEGYKSKYKSQYKGTIDFRRKHQIFFNNLDMSQEDIEELRARYDGEINYVDSEVHRLVSYLQKKNLLKKTIIIITADHGEALAENKVVGHGHKLNTVIQVPLIVLLPWNYSQQRISNVVELIDIAPSALTQLNIEVPPSFKGINIFNIDDNTREKFGFSQSGEWVIIRNKDYIFKTNTNKTVLYNLNSDPFEFTDISKDNIRQVEIFMSAYNLFQSKQDKIEMDYQVIDEETKEQLKALGYLQ